MAERSIMAGVRGLSWWVAVLLATALTTLGVFIDLQRTRNLGVVFEILYFCGCVLAVCWVQRRGLFGPMVQPPLLLAAAVPLVVLASGSLPTGGLVTKLIAVGSPLLNGFPTMAVTIGVTLVVGSVRVRLQRPSQSVRGRRLRTPRNPNSPARSRQTGAWVPQDPGPRTPRRDPDPRMPHRDPGPALPQRHSGARGQSGSRTPQRHAGPQVPPRTTGRPTDRR